MQLAKTSPDLNLTAFTCNEQLKEYITHEKKVH
jgi:hypothetical protein